MKHKKRMFIFSSILSALSLLSLTTSEVFISKVKAEDSTVFYNPTSLPYSSTVTETIEEKTKNYNYTFKPHTLKYLPAINNEDFITPLHNSDEEIDKKEKSSEFVEKEKMEKTETTTSHSNGIEDYLLFKQKQLALQKRQEDSTILSKEISDEKEIHNSKDFISYTNEELEMLAKIIHAEAASEPYEGKIAVGAVVLNRVQDPKFPNTIKEVIMAKGQFEPVSNGRYQDSIPTEEDYMAAIEAFNGVDPTNGATYFYAPKLTESRWHETLHYLKTIGNHRFFKSN